ncbi:MAG TPA: molybdopterin molybdotransferase MoeA [Ilumatobacteraceae bacterium]|nr:molybdopterin molybdotransferase MoeA [Ilumatobacteraceae bacterium]
MIEITEARHHVLDRCPPGAPVLTPVREAVGCVLAEPVVAVESVPPFMNSAVDGYAVQAASVAAAPVELPVVGEVAAGACSDRTLGPDEAIRIMTGAPVPVGADAVVMVEDTERLDGGSRVRVLRSVRAGSAVRGVGEDVAVGTQLYCAGTVITPAVLGVLASVNVREAMVYPRVRVAVLSTGDELVDDGSPLQPGQIRESNRSMLFEALRDAGCEAVDLGIVRDDEARLEKVLREAVDWCHAVVTSGGVSMGDYDVVRHVLAGMADMRWMQIAIKPAKPFAFGLLAASDGKKVPIFGLPGNPVSSLVSFELLARPALRRMMGHQHLDRPTVLAVAVDGLPRHADGKVHFARVCASFAADGRVHVRSAGAQGSHQLAATSMANALAVVPDGDGIAPGGDVATLLLSSDSMGGNPWV